MFSCMPPRAIVPQHRSRAPRRAPAAAVLLAVLLLFASAAAEAASRRASRPVAPSDLLSSLRAWLVALVAPGAGEEGAIGARTPATAEEPGLRSAPASSSSGNSDAGILIDPDGGH